MIFSSLALHNMPFDIQRLSFLIFGIFDQEYVLPYYELKLDRKKKSKFFEIFFNVFQFFGHPSHTKRSFCTFGPKITYSYIQTLISSSDIISR